MLEIVIIFILILLNAFFALSEIAVVSAKRTKLEAERKSGNKGAEIALKLQADPDNFLSAVQVGITLIGIVNGAYGGATISRLIEPFFLQFPATYPYASSISVVVVVVLITYLSIVVGELVPKTIALNNPEKIAIAVSRPIQTISILFFPFVKLLSHSTGLINRLIGLKPKEEIISEMELRAMLKSASNEGVIEQEENSIHEQVFYFSDKKAKHLMTHRTDVEWIDISKPREEVIDDLMKAEHTRILACNAKIDDFLGTIALKDFWLHHYRDQNFEIASLIQETLVFPSTMRAQKVLENFRNKHRSIAVVVDEYGSLDGVVTLHDIMETLVGTLSDETENEEPDIFMRNDNSALVNGEAPLETLTQFIEDFIIDFESIDYATVAGFVLANINKIPQLGDKFSFKNTEFEIVDMDGNKIDKLMITRKTD